MGLGALGAAQPRAHRAKQQQGCGGRDLRGGDAASAGEQDAVSATSAERLCFHYWQCPLSVKAGGTTQCAWQHVAPLCD